MGGAIKRNGKLASAYRWLAKVYRTQRETEKADEAAKRAKDVAYEKRDQNPSDYQLYALNGRRYMATLPIDCRGVRRSLKNLSNTSAREEIDFHNYCREIAAFLNYKEQLELYDSQLGKDRKQWTIDDVPFSLRKIHCYFYLYTETTDRRTSRNARVARAAF